VVALVVVLSVLWVVFFGAAPVLPAVRVRPPAAMGARVGLSRAAGVLRVFLGG
jgi:hypothetical protein